MSNFGAGLVSFVILLALLGLRVPIGVAMLAVGTGGFIWIQGLAPLLSFLKTTPFETFSGYSFSVIPLFLLMGNVASGAGLSARLFRGANALLGHHERRHGDGGGRGLRRLRHDLRLIAGDGGHHGAGGAAGDAQIRLLRVRSRPERWPPAARSAFWCRRRSRWSSTRS